MNPSLCLLASSGTVIVKLVKKGQGDYLVGKIESTGTLLLSSKKSDLFMT